jgi:hypothetical protein
MASTAMDSPSCQEKGGVGLKWRHIIQRRLLLDSRVVDLPMSFNPIVVTLSSLKPCMFNGLQ